MKRGVSEEIGKVIYNLAKSNKTVYVDHCGTLVNIGDLGRVLVDEFSNDGIVCSSFFPGSLEISGTPSVEREYPASLCRGSVTIEEYHHLPREGKAINPKKKACIFHAYTFRENITMMSIMREKNLPSICIVGGKFQIPRSTQYVRINGMYVKFILRVRVTLYLCLGKKYPDLGAYLSRLICQYIPLVQIMER